MQGENSLFHIPVRYVKGVGPRKAEVLQKIGINSVYDLFYHLPRRYEDRKNIVEIKDVVPGEYQGIRGKVLKTGFFRARTGTNIYEIALSDGTGKISALWYNQPYMKKVFSRGQDIVLYGKVEKQKTLQISHPVFVILDGKEDTGSLEVGRIVPVYPLTGDLSQKYMRKIVNEALSSHVKDAGECLPTSIRGRNKLVDARFAFENIHFPHSFDNLEKAYKRLVFEEFFILQTMLALRRRKNASAGIKYDVREGLFPEFEKLLSFSLTPEQKKCIKEIEHDMSSDMPMYRLLQGDVGSGKTVVSMYAMMLSAVNGYQSAMMCPTEVLARQHYLAVSRTFMPLGLNVELLVSGMDAGGKKRIKKGVAAGEVDIVIGTHSLIQEGVEYSNLGFAIIDEQHKFGVDQRKALISKGHTPDVLFMTATPIPRSLVMTVFGDMEVSSLREKPLGRESVVTYWMEEEKRGSVYAFIRGEVKKGRQAFIIYPRIKESEGLSVRSAEKMFDELRNGVFHDMKIALLHGKMPASEKDMVMGDFKGGKYDILVATTVVEVGVDIPNATIMLVEHAERYGVAQLHQLRGRVGRGKHASYCIFFATPGTDDSYERLMSVVNTDDGFELAEKDLEIRGPGQFLGVKQSGLPELKIGDIARDFPIMELARKEAVDLVNRDPGLEDAHNEGIRHMISERFRGKAGI